MWIPANQNLSKFIDCGKLYNEMGPSSPPTIDDEDINPELTKHESHLNTLRPRQNGRHFADDTFKQIFLNENIRISLKISLKFVPKGSINNIPALVQIMAWRRPGDKTLSEPMMVNLPTHICVTRPQWVYWTLLHSGALYHDNWRIPLMESIRSPLISPQCFHRWLTYSVYVRMIK